MSPDKTWAACGSGSSGLCNACQRSLGAPSFADASGQQLTVKRREQCRVPELLPELHPKPCFRTNCPCPLPNRATAGYCRARSDYGSRDRVKYKTRLTELSLPFTISSVQHQISTNPAVWRPMEPPTALCTITPARGPLPLPFPSSSTAKK